MSRRRPSPFTSSLRLANAIDTIFSEYLPRVNHCAEAHMFLERPFAVGLSRSGTTNETLCCEVWYNVIQAGAR